MGFLSIRTHEDGPAGTFVRQHDVDVLVKELAAVHEHGHLRVIELRAEAGAGKTTVLQHFVEEARATFPDVVVALGRARAAASRANAYQPIRRAIDSLASDTKPAIRARITSALSTLARNAPELVQDLPWVGKVVQVGQALRGHAKAGVDQLVSSPDRELIRFFASVAESSTLALVLDDMHWSDQSTLDLLLEMGEVSAGRPVLVVVAYRASHLQAPENANGLVDALDRLRRYRLVSGCLELDNLSDEAVSELVLGLIGKRPSADLLSWLREHCSGNPLYIEEYVALLSDTGRLVETEEAATLVDDGALVSPPASVAAVISERLRMVGPHTAEYRVLQAAAVHGGEFDGAAIASMTGTDATQARSALATACQRFGLLRATGSGYSFWHSVVREYLEADLRDRDLSEHRLLHQRAAELSEATRAASSEELVSRARHWRESGQRRSTLASAAAAGQLLTSLRSYSDALTVWTWALEAAHELDDQDANTRARVEAAYCLQALRRFHEARLMLEGARELTSEAEVVTPRLALTLAKVLRMENAWEEARHAIALAERSIDDGDPESRAEMLLLRAEVALCGAPRDLALSEASLEEARTLSEDPCRQAAILGHLALALLASGRSMESDQAWEQGFEAARASQSPTSLFELHLYGAHRAIALMRLEAASDHVDEMRRIAEEGRIFDTDVHRYAGRAHLLRDETAAGATSYCRLLLADLALGRTVRPTLAWCLTHVALQVDELQALGRAPRARSFLEALRADRRWAEVSALEPSVAELVQLLAAALELPERVRHQAAVRSWFADRWSAPAVASFDFYSHDVMSLRAGR